MDEVTIGVLALFGLLSIALTHGAKLARDIEEFIEAWRADAQSSAVVAPAAAPPTVMRPALMLLPA